MPAESRRTDEPPSVRPNEPPDINPEGREMAQEVTNPDNLDPHRPIGEGQPGHGAAPGGEPVAPPGQEAGGSEVAPPGTEDGGAPGGPPAAHTQPPK